MGAVQHGDGMGAVVELVEFLARRPEMTIALCLVAVIALVLVERLIAPAEAREG